MRKLLIYLKNYKKEVVLAPLFKMLEAFFELLVPLVMASIIDIGIPGNDKNYIVKMCLIMVALGVVGLVCTSIAQFFSAKAAAGFAAKLKRALFKHIQHFSFSEEDTMGSSTLINRITSDSNQLQTGVNLFLRLFMRSPFIVFGAMIMAFTIDVRSAMIFVVTIPLLMIVVFGIMLISLPLYRKVQQHLDNVLGSVRENLAGTRVIRAFNKEEEEISEFREKTTALNKSQLFVGRISALMNPLTFVIINLAIIVIINTGALRVDTGIITQGQLVALVNYMSQILIELIKLANLIIIMTKAVTSGRRIQKVFEIPTGITVNSFSDINEDKNIAVKFENVSLKYKNAGAESLSNINFEINRGQTVGIIGGTGSGKTSVVNLIPRFYDVTEGRVLVNGVNANEYPVEQLRKKIGIVPQKAVLFKGTIRTNLLWGNDNASEDDLWEALAIAQADAFVKEKEGVLDAYVAQNGRNFSGGQRQRLTIARALVRKPEILILDDSSSALDYATDAALRKEIKNLSYRPTTFIVSQRTASIQHADSIIVMDDGEMVGVGTHEELLESCEVYKEIYSSQFKKAK